MLDISKILQEGITIQSSGTSGLPKSFFQSPQKLKYANLVAIEAQELSIASVVYTCCKVTHAGGLLAQTLPALSIGAKVDIVQFNAWEFVRVIGNYTHTHITPLHAKAIMLTKGFKDLDLTGIWITCGADPVTWDVIDAFVSKGATFMVNWGMSEIGPVAINKVFKDKEETNYLKINDATILGDRFYCDWKIDNNELVVKSNICIYDDWYYTKDKVLLTNNVLYYTGRTNKEVDLCSPKKG
jgi:acyl-CoA synthetase (AMP-forming)/AMP-acid ligase II